MTGGIWSAFGGGGGMALTHDVLEARTGVSLFMTIN